MKRFLLYATLIQITFISISQAVDFGIDFSVGSTAFIGPNIRFCHLYELKPSISLAISDRDERLGVTVSNNFYLPDIKNIQQYIGFGGGYYNDFFNYPSSDNFLVVSAHYGLRYNLNETISFYGEVGILAEIDPFILTTARSGLGITFYLPKKQ